MSGLLAFMGVRPSEWCGECPLVRGTFAPRSSMADQATAYCPAVPAWRAEVDACALGRERVDPIDRLVESTLAPLCVGEPDEKAIRKVAAQCRRALFDTGRKSVVVEIVRDLDQPIAWHFRASWRADKRGERASAAFTFGVVEGRFATGHRLTLAIMETIAVRDGLTADDVIAGFDWPEEGEAAA